MRSTRRQWQTVQRSGQPRMLCISHGNGTQSLPRAFPCKDDHPTDQSGARAELWTKKHSAFKLMNAFDVEAMLHAAFGYQHEFAGNSGRLHHSRCQSTRAA